MSSAVASARTSWFPRKDKTGDFQQHRHSGQTGDDAKQLPPEGLSGSVSCARKTWRQVELDLCIFTGGNEIQSRLTGTRQGQLDKLRRQGQQCVTRESGRLTSAATQEQGSPDELPWPIDRIDAQGLDRLA